MTTPARTYAIVTQGVAQIIADLAPNDVEAVACQISRAALLHVRAAKGARVAAQKAYNLADEFAAEGP